MQVPAKLPRTTNIEPIPSPSFVPARTVRLPGDVIAASVNSVLVGKNAIPIGPFNILGGSLGLVRYIAGLRPEEQARPGDALVEFVPADHEVLGIPLHHCFHMMAEADGPVLAKLNAKLGEETAQVAHSPMEWIPPMASDPPFGIRWTHVSSLIPYEWEGEVGVVTVPAFQQGTVGSVALPLGGAPVPFPGIGSLGDPAHAVTLQLTEDWTVAQVTRDQAGLDTNRMEGPVVHWDNPRQSLEVPVLGLVPTPALIDRRGGTESMILLDWTSGGVTTVHEGVSRSTHGENPLPLREVITEDLCSKLGVARGPLMKELEFFERRDDIREGLIELQKRGKSHRRKTESPRWKARAA